MSNRETYILRVARVEDDAHHERLALSLQSVRNGERHSFYTVSELMAFLDTATHAGDAPAEPSPKEDT
jgi:hypothetical protein